MIEYPAKIKYSKTDKCYLVEFPDLEGCLTYGETLEEAKNNAADALSGYLTSIDLRQLTIPEPSRLKGNELYYIKPEPIVAFAIWLKLNRKKMNLTQKDMAKKLNIKFQSYQKFENSKKSNPTLKTIIKIEKVFDEKLLNI